MPPLLLPLFPLPLVLFPGTTLPLHIFEPRYRRMLADCRAGDGRFGIVRLPEGTAERDLATGAVGCVAEIVDAVALPDGRSNIVVRGVERFALDALVESTTPYHVGRVHPYADEPESGTDVEGLAAQVRALFRGIGEAARTLADSPTATPELPPENELLSFSIASMIDLDLDARQALLASQSPSERLRRLEAVLTPALPALARRAEVHERAKSNGKGTAHS